ncbi:hypothetical protein [Rhizobium sp. L51/94]|nr:hypothetical protein [Rhizobium sp. L51/94]
MPFGHALASKTFPEGAPVRQKGGQGEIDRKFIRLKIAMETRHG